MPNFGAVYRGTVVNSMDPMNQKRVQVRCESVPGASGASWAEACLPPGSTAGYKPGDRVWICFEAGDPARPVVMGRMGS